MKQHRLLLWLAALSISLLALTLFAEEAEPILTESESVVEDTNAAAPALDLSKYAVEVSRMGSMLNIQYKADNYEAMAALQKLSAPSIEIYKGDLLLASGTLEFG